MGKDRVWTQPITRSSRYDAVQMGRSDPVNGPGYCQRTSGNGWLCLHLICATATLICQRANKEGGEPLANEADLQGTKTRSVAKRLEESEKAGGMDEARLRPGPGL